jgi:hypothetical protein
VRSHQWIDQRSLAFHEAVAAKLAQRPELVEVARTNVERWLRRGPVPALTEWQDLLDREPLDRILAILRSPTETARRLRQSSPFAGVLTAAERQAILSEYESQRA